MERNSSRRSVVRSDVVEELNETKRRNSRTVDNADLTNNFTNEFHIAGRDPDSSQEEPRAKDPSQQASTTARDDVNNNGSTSLERDFMSVKLELANTKGELDRLRLLLRQVSQERDVDTEEFDKSLGVRDELVKRVCIENERLSANAQTLQSENQRLQKELDLLQRVVADYCTCDAVQQKIPQKIQVGGGGGGGGSIRSARIPRRISASLGTGHKNGDIDHSHRRGDSLSSYASIADAIENSDKQDSLGSDNSNSKISTNTNLFPATKVLVSKEKQTTSNSGEASRGHFSSILASLSGGAKNDFDYFSGPLAPTVSPRYQRRSVGASLLSIRAKRTMSSPSLGIESSMEGDEGAIGASETGANRRERYSKTEAIAPAADPFGTAPLTPSRRARSKIIPRPPSELPFL